MTCGHHARGAVKARKDEDKKPNNYLAGTFLAKSGCQSSCQSSPLKTTRWSCYTDPVQNDQEFGIAAEAALDGLKRHLVARGEEEPAVFEVERRKGKLNVLFDHPDARFEISPNTPLHQIWICALATSFKLNWDSRMEEFILPRTGETLIALVERLIGERRAA